MASMIRGYRTPRSAAEVASVLRLFLEEEVGVSSNLTPKGGGHHIYVELEDGEAEEDVSVFVGGNHGATVLGDDELKVVEAMRSGRAGYYPAVIAGLKTPADAAGLLEWIRLAIDVNTPLTVGYCGRMEGLEVALPGGEEVRLVLAGDGPPGPAEGPTPAAPPELGARVRLAVDPAWAEGPTGGLRGLDVEVRVMGRDAWEAMGREARRRWSGQALDDGRVLAVRAAEDDGRGLDAPEEPERVAAVRSLRGRLLDFLEDCELVSYVDCQAGGNGGATYRLTVEGEATAAAPDPIREHLLITLASDPDN